MPTEASPIYCHPSVREGLELGEANARAEGVDLNAVPFYRDTIKPRLLAGEITLETAIQLADDYYTQP